MLTAAILAAAFFAICAGRFWFDAVALGREVFDLKLEVTRAEATVQAKANAPSTWTFVEIGGAVKRANGCVALARPGYAWLDAFYTSLRHK